MSEDPRGGRPLSALLLVDHGSRAPRANARLGELATLLERYLASRGIGHLVYFAHMELAEPSISAAVAQCAQAGATQLAVVPCMLSRGRHVEQDIPRLVHEAVREYPQLTVRVQPPLSEQAFFIEWLGESVLRGMS